MPVVPTSPILRALWACGLLAGLAWGASVSARGDDPGRTPEKPRPSETPASEKAPEKKSLKEKADKAQPEQPRVEKKGDKAPADKRKKNDGKPAKPMDEQPAASKETKAGAKLKPNRAAKTELNAQREQAALDFAREHHPELAELVGLLRDSNPAEYAKALRELSRTHERLHQLRDKSPARYAFDLDCWKSESQIRLLVARLTMSPDPELEAQLRAAVTRQNAARLALLKQQREEVATRLEKLNAEIAVEETRRGELDQLAMEKLLKTIDQQRQGRKARKAEPKAVTDAK